MMAVTITVAATQNLGMHASQEGQTILHWRVTFQLDGPGFLTAAIPISVKGPTTPREAQKNAVKVLREFLSEGYAAAKNYDV
jgi:hypothetical protein